MSDTTTNILSSDIYKISSYVDAIKAKYVDIPEDTLFLGVFGYLSSAFNNIIENTVIMASEYSQEAIPTKAKFERNIIAHALSLGINKIAATPAEIDVIIGFPEEALLANMTNNKFIIDKEYAFQIGSNEMYPYHLDYDIVLRRDKLPNGSYVYSAKYDVDNTNTLINMVNPYLPTIGVVNIDGDSMVTLKTTIRQVEHTQIYRKILVDNPLENKVLTFSFNDQLAYFYVDVVDNGTTHYLKPVYDGLYDYTADEEFINYLYLDESNIRLTFNRSSYTPRQNVEVTIHVFTTKGATCNFTLNSYQLLRPLTSDRFTYNSMYVLLQSASDSQYGSDKLSVDDLKLVIPREALSRGSVTTYTDLNNTFNAIQTEDCKMYFLEKVHNQVERLYFSYLLMKDGSNVIPTNTITANLTRAMFDATSKDNFIIKPGAAYYIDPDTSVISGVANITSTQITSLDKASFLYMNPFLMVINKSPFYVSYYLTLINYTRILYFDYINEDSTLQFVTLNFYIHRDFYTDPDTIKIEIVATQNINTDFQLITYANDGSVSDCKFAMYAVFYTTDSDGTEIAVRYAKATLEEYDETNFEYHMLFTITTNDIISAKGTYMTMTSGLYPIGKTVESQYALPPNVKMKVFYLAKLDTVPSKGRVYGDNESLNLDDLIPGLDKYTLTNVYSAGSDGLDLYYDYSDLQTSYITLTQSTNTYNYKAYKIPVVKYTYLNTESRIRNLLKIIDKKRRYIQNVLLLLEDSFGIDYKFFNTYGPSTMYNIDNETNIDRINLSLTFEVKFQIASEKIYITNITNSIKEYIEDMNNITDLHMPNLITYITNLYREQLVYIKFIGLNNYTSLHQSIYKNPIIDADYFVETQTVPEFINVNTLSNDYPDITFKIVT